MEVVHRRCAGIDISKRDAKVCVRVQGSGRRSTTASVTTWGAMSNEILSLREHLVAEKVTCVVMESTGDYWKPFYYLLEDAVNVMLVNSRDARNRPGRKTDVSDSAWLADLGAHGLLRASLVPPPPIRRLRDLTRARTDLNRDRVRQIHRLEKILQDAGIKLSSVHQVDVDARQEWIQRGAVERSVVLHPAPHDRVDLSGDVGEGGSSRIAQRRWEMKDPAAQCIW
jgi:transposase